MYIRKAFQGTVPENKILDTYSESQTDTYSCNYVNKKSTYSTEEQVIGTWLGKPLYRKTFTITEISSLPYELDISSLNPEEVFFDLGHSYFCNPPSHTGTVYTLHFGNYAGETDWGRMYWGKGTTFNRIDFQFGGSYSNLSKIVATIEYTKTTD